VGTSHVNTWCVCLRFNFWGKQKTGLCDSISTQYMSARTHPNIYNRFLVNPNVEYFSVRIYSRGGRLDPLLLSHHIYLYHPEPWSCSRSPSSPSCAGPRLMTPWSATARPTWITRPSCRSTSACRQPTTVSTGITLTSHGNTEEPEWVLTFILTGNGLIGHGLAEYV